MPSPPASLPCQQNLLPPHSVRSSRRARRVSLRVVPGKGLEVVLPLHVDPACVPEVLDRHKAWIDKALRRVPPAVAAARCPWPETVFLKGGAEVVVFSPNGGGPTPPVAGEVCRGALTSPPPSCRTLDFPELPLEARFTALREWVREEARRCLGDMLAETASAHGFRHGPLSIRFQKSRWGSCSVKGAISLNACLVFLPERLARYIVLHELCHTRHMNHSASFWKLVFALDSDALSKDRAMRWAWKYVPPWVFV